MKGIGLSLALALVLSARATDTAFWQPYAADDKTYALLHFDAPAPLTGEGRLAGTGQLAGGAALAAEGKYGGGLRLDGTGHAAFPTTAFDPAALAINSNNRTFSSEAWVKLDRYPAAGKTAMVVARPGAPGTLGFALYVDAEGALGMRVNPIGKPAAEFKSRPGQVPVGTWTHLAGVSSAGIFAIGRNTLYVNGAEVYNGPAAEAAGVSADQVAAELRVGEGLAGLLDELRLHSQVAKFWPPEPLPWLTRLAEKGLPPLSDVLARNRQPVLLFPLDGDGRPVASEELQARDPAVGDRFKVTFNGDYVPGVMGQAARGRLAISGYPLADLKEGSFEFWMQPRGVNSLSDRNVTVFSSPAISAYFFNDVRATRALAFFYKDSEGRLRMHQNGLGTEFHPGRWYHLAFTWDAGRVTLYVDGQAAAAGGNALATAANKGLLDSLCFNPHQTAFEIDALALYPVCLTAAEVANRYWSYVEPQQMIAARTPAPVRLDAWRLPSENVIVYRLEKTAKLADGERAVLRLTDAKGAEILAVERPLASGEARLATPSLPDGVYTFNASVGAAGQELSAEPIRFTVRRLPWEGNTLGLSNEVFPPFTPVKVDGETVSVVLRHYRMNSFGLWDSVISQGRELLAAPMRLRYESEAGTEGGWQPGQGRFTEARAHRAEYRVRSSSPAVTVETVAEIEMDGMMKLTMTLGPGAKPERIKRLWLEIPLKAAEAPLMHEDTGSMRGNYSGWIPQGTGTVWQARRRGVWRNAFCGYLWLGGEERGLAWFAENDRGWITAKNQSDRPLQELVREDGRVTLRVYLVDIPAVIAAPRTLVFGLQASPAKPLPEDWRTGARGGGLPVVPWGGHQCADKFPFEDRWEIVDKIIETQLERKDHSEWFKALQKEHDIPPLRGTEDWLKSVGHFAGYPNYRNRPVLVYFEEMAASTYRPEWHVYKDEWSRDLPEPRQSWPDGYDVFRQGRGVAGTASRVTFGPSYRDYGAWYANEWLKRGVGIYWDNSYLTTTTHPFTSAAYRTEDGQIQPALTLWNQREYAKRVWNLLRHWERERQERLLFLQHMTNASLLPVLAWCSTAFDNEFSPEAFARNVGYPRRHEAKEPFPPDYLRAQSLGRQTGCYPALCHNLFAPGEFDIALAAIPASETMTIAGKPDHSIYAQKREWGMRRVHEIPGGGFASERYEKALCGFGYGTPAVQVHSYWAEKPAVKLDNPDVKWLLVARPADKRLLLILQSWSRQPGTIVKGEFDFAVLGFRPAGGLANLETGAAIPSDGEGFTLTLAGAYGFAMLGAGAPPLPEGIRFADDFGNGPSLRWSYVSSFFDVQARDGGGGALRLAENRTPWQGPARLELWDGNGDWRDGTLELRFRVLGVTSTRTPLFTVVTRAGRPAWSPHGLTHTRLENGQFLTLSTNPATGSWGLSRWTVNPDGKRGKATEYKFGVSDDRPHTLALAIAGTATKVLCDGVEVAAFADTPEIGTAFGIRAADGLSEKLYVELSGIVVRNGLP